MLSIILSLSENTVTVFFFVGIFVVASILISTFSFLYGKHRKKLNTAIPLIDLPINLQKKQTYFFIRNFGIIGNEEINRYITLLTDCAKKNGYKLDYENEYKHIYWRKDYERKYIYISF